MVVPARSRLDVEDLLAAHADWIHRSLTRMTRRPAPRHTPLVHGSLLPYLGAVLRLEVDSAPDGLPQFDPRQGILRIRAAGAGRSVREIEGWYRRQADTLFPERLRVVNGPVGFRFGRVTVRDQRTRWGSCSARGNLAFNWRLVMAPLAIVDSVIAHELTHLVDPTHAPGFWQRLAAIDPAYQSHRRWLRQYGTWLEPGCDPPPAVLP